MAVKLERLVKTYYESLGKGVVLGRKCPKCGAVEWPPVYACNACGSLETEWYEMSGKGEIQMLIMPTVMSFKPAYKDLEPYAYGAVKTAEGPERNVMILGVTKKNEKYIREHMPYPVHMQIVQRDGYKTAVFAIDPIDENGNPVEAPQAVASAKAAGAAGGESETLKKLKELVAQAYKRDVNELRADMEFEGELKSPSVVFVGLVAQLEEEFDKMISITDAAATKTIGGLAALIDGKEAPEEDVPAADDTAKASAPAGAAASGVETETLKKLKELVAQAYKRDVNELTADMEFEGELKAPSVVFVGLVAQIEEEFDKMISITDASASKTIGGLADLIDRS